VSACLVHQEQRACAEQAACGVSEAGFQKLCPSCLTWQVMKNEELSLELLNLANARSTCPRTEGYRSPAKADESSAKLERVRAMVHCLSARKVKVKTSLSCCQAELLGEQESNRHLLLSLTKTSQKM